MTYAPAGGLCARPCEAIMFERTVSFWRRLLGSRPRPTASAEAKEERRVWVRFPADLETTYRPTATADPTRFAAVVRDISGGGLSVVADRSFVPGDLLTVDLPGPTGQDTFSVLACVVHVTPQTDGRWILGCTFARELSDADLTPFGARRSRPEDADQRSWDRYSCDLRAFYQVPTVPEAGTRPATVLNISASGVGLLVDQPVENGTLLSVELQSPLASTGKTMLCCVVHVTRQGDAEWALGCNFITELSESDLLALL
jgi:hypothetical protein